MKRSHTLTGIAIGNTATGESLGVLDLARDVPGLETFELAMVDVDGISQVLRVKINGKKYERVITHGYRAYGLPSTIAAKFQEILAESQAEPAPKRGDPYMGVAFDILKAFDVPQAPGQQRMVALMIHDAADFVPTRPE